MRDALTTAATPRWLPIPGLRDFWQAGRVIRNGFPLRAIAFRLGSGGLAISSPIRGLGEDAHRELTAIGAPAILIAPNKYHHLGLDEYATAYPAAVIVSSARAARRLDSKCEHPIEPEDRLREALPQRITVLEPPTARNGELWLSVKGDQHRAWIVGDGFFNIPRTPRSPTGLLLKALGIAPGLRIASTFRWLVKDHPTYKRWLLAKIAEEQPTMLVPCHGDVIVDATLPDRLRRLAEDRIG